MKSVVEPPAIYLFPLDLKRIAYTVVGANLCARDPLQEKGRGIRGAGGVADKEAYTVHTKKNIISQRRYFVAQSLISCVDNVFGLHRTCVCVPSTRKLVT
jgi:hypothetical protein